MHFSGVRRARSRSGRALVGSRPRNGSRGIAAGLVLESVDRRGIEISLESAVVAASWLLAGCGGAIGHSRYPSSIPNAHRVAEILGARELILSLRAVLQNPLSLAQFCLVSAEPRLCGFLVWHPAAFHVQWEIILGAGTAVRRNPVWAVRQSESFCRPDGVTDPPRACHSDPGGGTARPVAVSDPLHLAADRGAVFVRFPRRNHQSGGGGGLSHDIDCGSPKRKKGAGCRRADHHAGRHSRFMVGNRRSIGPVPHL